MDVMELMRARHSVRAYESRPVEEEKVALLEAELAACNAQGGLRMRAVFGEKGAFSSAMAKYGKFSGVENISPSSRKRERRAPPCARGITASGRCSRRRHWG